MTMPADIRSLAQEAVELAGKATPGPWEYDVADDCVVGPADCLAAPVLLDSFDATPADGMLTAHAGTHYATIARALLEALDERDEARGSNILNRNAVRRLSAEKDALLAALPHALGICGCERVDVPGLHSGAGGPVYEWPEEHEAAIEWLRGRIE